jgi:diguanylate cyclase (GGDEF)-like protein
MTHPHWRLLIGPLITLVSVISIHVVNHYLFVVPSPIAIPFFAVVFSAAIGGIGPGLVSALVSLGAAPSSLSITGLPVQLHPNDLAQLAMLVVIAPASAVFIGLIRARAIHAMRRVQEGRFEAQASHRELIALRAGLDRIEVGMALLDQGRNAQFINRAFRRIWRLPDDLENIKLPFANLMMYHGRESEVCPIPSADFDTCVAKQLEIVRSADERPVDIRLTNGEVFRFGCKTLPGGGSFLCYSNVTDLIRQTDILEEVASIDGLTRLYNRRHFLNLCENEWVRFRRYGRPPAIILLDIDFFKSINDRHGHDIGDRVLMEVAHVLRSEKRATDFVGRLGGEEFALLLPDVSLESACAAADRLRRAVANRVIVVEQSTISITVSLGVSVTREGMDGIAELIKEADVALYDAKRSGRNRVCTFDRSKASAGKAPAPDRQTATGSGEMTEAHQVLAVRQFTASSIPGWS